MKTWLLISYNIIPNQINKPISTEMWSQKHVKYLLKDDYFQKLYLIWPTNVTEAHM